MEYKCETINIDKLPISPVGVVPSLCEHCKTIDCTNPIERRNISIIGVSREIKLYMRGSSPYFVVKCSGFTSE